MFKPMPNLLLRLRVPPSTRHSDGAYVRASCHATRWRLEMPRQPRCASLSARCQTHHVRPSHARHAVEIMNRRDTCQTRPAAARRGSRNMLYGEPHQPRARWRRRTKANRVGSACRCVRTGEGNARALPRGGCARRKTAAATPWRLFIPARRRVFKSAHCCMPTYLPRPSP